MGCWSVSDVRELGSPRMSHSERRLVLGVPRRPKPPDLRCPAPIPEPCHCTWPKPVSSSTPMPPPCSIGRVGTPPSTQASLTRSCFFPRCPDLRNSIRCRKSGCIDATTGCRCSYSKPATISSRGAARSGAASPIGLNDRIDWTAKMSEGSV